MTIDELVIAGNLTNTTINLLDQYFLNHTYNDTFLNTDLEFVVQIMKGALNSFDTITVDNINKGLTYMKACIAAHTEVVYTYSQDFQKDHLTVDDFFEVMSMILGKFYFDVRVMEVDLAYSADDIYNY